MLRVFLALLVLLVACTPPRDPSCRLVADVGSSSAQWYTVHPTKTTPAGTPFDDSGLGLTGDLYDGERARVVACLARKHPDHTLSVQVVNEAHCRRNPNDPSLMDPAKANDPATLPVTFADLPATCTILKVVSDCTRSETEWPPPSDPGHHFNQVLKSVAPCDVNKPIPASGVCHPRAFIQQYTTIVTCPSGFLVADMWVRLITGCENPWGSLDLAECAEPSPGLDPLGTGR